MTQDPEADSMFVSAAMQVLHDKFRASISEIASVVPERLKERFNDEVWEQYHEFSDPELKFSSAVGSASPLSSEPSVQPAAILKEIEQTLNEYTDRLHSEAFALAAKREYGRADEKMQESSGVAAAYFKVCRIIEAATQIEHEAKCRAAG